VTGASVPVGADATAAVVGAGAAAGPGSGGAAPVTLWWWGVPGAWPPTLVVGTGARAPGATGPLLADAGLCVLAPETTVPVAALLSRELPARASAGTRAPAGDVACDP